MYTPNVTKAGILTGVVGFTIKSLAVVVAIFAFVGIYNIVIRKIKSKNDLWK